MPEGELRWQHYSQKCKIFMPNYQREAQAIGKRAGWWVDEVGESDFLYLLGCVGSRLLAEGEDGGGGVRGLRRKKKV